MVSRAGLYLAAGFGAPIAAFSLGVIVVAGVSDDPAVAFASGAQVIIPAWVVLVLTLPLCSKSRYAWGACALPTAIAFAVRALGGGA